ncbi:MAG: sulfite exporter TauE/SafE family protein [Maricaulaceae bacterium]
MIADPIFWITAVIAVIITGISKGGFGGLALMAVPLMALTISPVQAAGILLPILIVMDWTGVWAYRKHWDKRILIYMLPGAIAGIALGGLLAGYVDDRLVRTFVGLIAILFSLYAIAKQFTKTGFTVSALKNNHAAGAVAGVVAGFTSFIAHAGGPPFQAYVIPQNLETRIYAGTAVMFFFVVNFVKIMPYAMIGQFDKTNLTTSLVLIPLAPVGVLIGAWLVTRINQKIFYRILYGLILIVGSKLLYDGVAA